MNSKRLGVRVRWIIFAGLLGFSFFGYIQRSEISIVGESIMQDLSLSQQLFGWLITFFLIGYTVFQIPAAIFGEYAGARRALTFCGTGTILSICVVALVPRLQSTVLIAVLLSAQLMLGVFQAGLYPVASGAIGNWFPSRSWGLAQGLMVTGSWFGSAVTPPLVSALIVLVGWRPTMVLTCVPSVLLVVFWQRYSRDRPADHAGVSQAELAELHDGSAAPEPGRISAARIKQLILSPQIAMITVSYFLSNYVFYLVMFWSFIYLRQERHMTVLESGWAASLPFVCAACSAAIGGRLSDYFSQRLGLRWGMRVLPLLALPCTALFLWLTGVANNASLSVVALCLAFGFCELMEGPFWSAAMRVAPADAMAATAILNTGGNLGGVVATPAIAALSAGHRWGTVFACGALASLAAALFWFRIDVSRATPRCETAA